MKRFTTFLTVLLCIAATTGFANAGTPVKSSLALHSKSGYKQSPEAVKKHSRLIQAAGTTCDTISNLSASDQASLYTWEAPLSGFVSGNASLSFNDTLYFPTTGIGEEFGVGGSNLDVTGAQIFFGYAVINKIKADSALKVTAYVYDTSGTGAVGTGAPGKALDSAKVALSTIAADVTAGNPTIFTFTHNRILSNPYFFITVTLPTKTGDTLAVLTNVIGSTDGYGWLDLPAAGGWASYYDLIGENLGNYIFPVVCGDICFAPTITASGATTFCQGGSVTLTASSGNSYSWSNGATTQAITVTTSGNYAVTVNNGTNCVFGTDTVAVIVNAAPKTPKITASGAVSFCKGGSVTLTATTATSYLWSDNETTKAITVSATGSYIVTVSNSSGCQAASAAKKVTVTADPVPSITTSGTVCPSGTETLTEKVIGKDTYKWSTGATTNAIKITTPGTYVVTVTGTTALHCSASASKVIATCAAPETSDDKTNTNLENTSSNNSFQASVYPNPYGSEFHVRVESSSTANVSVRIYDLTGQLIEQKQNIAYGSDIMLGNTYAAGIYMVQVQQGQTSQTLHIIKSE
jgi:hypothetical protein